MRTKKELAGYLQQVADPKKVQTLLAVSGELNLPVVRIMRDPKLVKTERPYIDVDLAGYRHSLLGMDHDSVFTIGRAEHSDVQVQDYEDTSISRVHVVVFKKDDELIIANVGGSGTIVLDADGAAMSPELSAEFAGWDKFLG